MDQNQKSKKDTNGENVNPDPLTCQYNTEMHKYTQTRYKYRSQSHSSEVHTHLGTDSDVFLKRMYSEDKKQTKNPKKLDPQWFLCHKHSSKELKYTFHYRVWQNKTEETKKKGEQVRRDMMLWKQFGQMVSIV